MCMKMGYPQSYGHCCCGRKAQSYYIFFIVYHFSIQWIWSSDVLTTVWSCQIGCGKLGHVQDLEGTLVTANNYPRLWDLVAFQNHPKSIVS